MILNAEMDIRAVQDRGCLSAAKFFYHFPAPISHGLAEGFDGCEVVVREFSRMVPLAKDLLSIRSPGEFRAELIVGAKRAVVYFNGSAKTLPLESMDAFARRLHGLGFGRIDYSSGPSARCDQCAAGVLKGCSGARATRHRPILLSKQ